MTLCGSEVPQDRWRGRTAGSGMWTLTMREAAIMESRRPRHPLRLISARCRPLPTKQSVSLPKARPRGYPQKGSCIRDFHSFCTPLGGVPRGGPQGGSPGQKGAKAGSGPYRPKSGAFFWEMRFFNLRFTVNTAGDAFPCRCWSPLQRYQLHSPGRDREPCATGSPGYRGKKRGLARSEIRGALLWPTEEEGNA